MKKALFLDRDGVINIDYGHVFTIKNFHFIKGIFELCNYFQNEGYIIIVITNQAGIGKGLYSLKEFKKINNWMIKQFKKKGIIISRTYYCPHVPEDHCNCRKPSPGMLIEAIKEYNIDVTRSYLIGDKDSDIIAAISAGIKNTILFQCDNHTETLMRILEEEKK